MSQIKELLKERGIGVSELAEALGVSRQALSRQIQGKMLVETAERIAAAIGVPLWRLFAPSDSPTAEEPAYVIIGGRLHKASTPSELRALADMWERG